KSIGESCRPPPLSQQFRFRPRTENSFRQCFKYASKVADNNTTYPIATKSALSGALFVVLVFIVLFFCLHYSPAHGFLAAAVLFSFPVAELFPAFVLLYLAVVA